MGRPFLSARRWVALIPTTPPLLRVWRWAQARLRMDLSLLVCPEATIATSTQSPALTADLATPPLVSAPASLATLGCRATRRRFSSELVHTGSFYRHMYLYFF